MGRLFGADHRLEVLDDGRGVVEVVEQPAPLLERFRTPKALGVVFQSLPFDQQEVAPRRLETTFEPHRATPGGSGDERTGEGEGRLVSLVLTGVDIEDDVLEDHCPRLTRPRLPAAND
jgi:hypothetical protein